MTREHTTYVSALAGVQRETAYKGVAEEAIFSDGQAARERGVMVMVIYYLGDERDHFYSLFGHAIFF